MKRAVHLRVVRNVMDGALLFVSIRPGLLAPLVQQLFHWVQASRQRLPHVQERVASKTHPNRLQGRGRIHFLFIFLLVFALSVKLWAITTVSV